MSEPILLEYHGKTAIMTLNLPKKLNALTQDLYYLLATKLREVAARDDISITILTAKGRYFSAGADVQASPPTPSSSSNVRRSTMQSFAANNLDVTTAFYTHPKILITALNGPVIGLSAALISHSDFIYATPSTFLLTPFTSLGLVAEGGSSVSLVQRLGISKANEALIMSKRIASGDLERTGFVNKVFEVKEGDNEGFMGLVMKEVEETLGGHLNQDSLIKVKQLVRKPDRQRIDQANVDEVFGGVERFVHGAPQKEFAAIASGRKRHKL